MAHREKYLTPTASGVQARRKFRGIVHTKHFPHGTPAREIRVWLLAIELKHKGKPPQASGTFPSDVERYLTLKLGTATYQQRATHMAEWVEAFGPILTADITSFLIAQQLTRFRTEPRRILLCRPKPGATPKYKTLPCLAAQSVNKRRTALMDFFTRLNGKAAPNPVDDTDLCTPPADKARGIPYAVIEQVFAAMPPSKSKARAMVLAYTGIPQIQIAQIEPHDVNLVEASVSLPGRHKGDGTEAVVLPLNAFAIDAFKMMAREEAWGAFTCPPLLRAFKRACRRTLGHARFTAYDLRHSFGSEIYRSTGDIKAAQHLLQHSTSRLTDRYTRAAVDGRLVHAQAQFGKSSPQQGV